MYPRKKVATDFTTIKTSNGCIFDPVIAYSNVPCNMNSVFNLEKPICKHVARKKVLPDLNQAQLATKSPKKRILSKSLSKTFEKDKFVKNRVIVLKEISPLLSALCNTAKCQPLYYVFKILFGS